MTSPALVPHEGPPDTRREPWTPDQVELLKRTVAKGSSDDELQLFLHICTRTGLDPFAKQIYAIKRGGVMTVQTAIDGYRTIAERTGKYSPGREPTYVYGDGQTASPTKIVSATAYVQKMTDDGTWHEVAATAFWSEYALDSPFWKKMPHNQIAKCAEALCLRKAFPRDLSGLYTFDEMAQADNGESQVGSAPPALLEPRRKSEMEQATEQAAAVERFDTEPAEIVGEPEPSDAMTRTLTQAEIGSLMGLVAQSKRSKEDFNAFVKTRWEITSRKQLQFGWLAEISTWLAAGG